MKKFMVALTGLVTVATLGATFTVPTTGITANAATKTAKKVTNPKLTVSAIYSNTKTIKGTATKGSKITVKATKNAKKNLATATASTKTGKYSAKLAKTLKAKSTVYVYATNPKTKAYYYEVIHVQTPKKVTTKKAATKTTKKTTTTTKTTTKKAVAPTLTVSAIYNNTKTIKGTATKGSKITVKATKNAKKNLATATASTKTGKYSAKLAKTLKSGTKVYVRATNPKTKAYYYEIIHVQTPKKATTTKKAATKTTTKKATTKKATTKKATAKKTTKSFDIKALAGTWKSNTANKYSQTWTFSNKKGMNTTLYKNGKKVKKLVSYASYKTSATKTANVWKLTYTPSGAKKSTTVYLRYTSAKKFTLVNAKNQVVKTKAGVAPAAAWTFTQK